MNFSYSEDVEAFRQEVRAFIKKEWHPSPMWAGESDETAEYGRAFRDKLAEKGWLAVSLPKEYGGAGLPRWHQYVFHEELASAGAPGAGMGLTIVAPTLNRIGTDDQKRRFLPRVMSGEIDFCLGYTEPNAGSDLASLQTRAVQDGDEFVINGQKMFTSMGHTAQYCWLAARTDPNAPKHRGISIFLVDMKTPGITVKPLWTMADGRTNATYWDDVRVPKENLVGELNRGWYILALALDFERSAVRPVATIRSVFNRLVAYVKEAERNGKPLKHDPDVRDKIARISCDLEVAEVLSLRVAWMQAGGTVPNYESSMVKVFNSELIQRTTYLASRILGLYGSLAPGSPQAPLQGYFERQVRQMVSLTFTAGSDEIQRGIIATRGLGLPR